MWHTKLLIVSSDFVGPKYVVPVESDLGKEKGLEILSLFVNMKKADLPEQAYNTATRSQSKAWYPSWHFHQLLSARALSQGCPSWASLSLRSPEPIWAPSSPQHL